MRGDGRLSRPRSMPLGSNHFPPRSSSPTFFHHLPTLTHSHSLTAARVPLPACGCNAPVWPSPPLPNQPSTSGRLTARPARLWLVLARPRTLQCYNYTTQGPGGGAGLAGHGEHLQQLPTRPMPASALQVPHTQHSTRSSENGGRPAGGAAALLWSRRRGQAVSHPVSGLFLTSPISHILASHCSQGTPPSSCSVPFSFPSRAQFCCCAVVPSLNHIAFCDVQRFPARPGACAYIHTYVLHILFLSAPARLCPRCGERT